MIGSTALREREKKNSSVVVRKNIANEFLFSSAFICVRCDSLHSAAATTTTLFSRLLLSKIQFICPGDYSKRLDSRRRSCLTNPSWYRIRIFALLGCSRIIIIINMLICQTDLPVKLTTCCCYRGRIILFS